MRLPVLPFLDPSALPALQAHQDDLTKPQGSLGRLEALGLQMAWIARNPVRRTPRPTSSPSAATTASPGTGSRPSPPK